MVIYCFVIFDFKNLKAPFLKKAPVFVDGDIVYVYSRFTPKDKKKRGEGLGMYFNNEECLFFGDNVLGARNQGIVPVFEKN